MNRKILISVNTAWNVVNFRSGLIKALISQGYSVTVVAPSDEYAPYLRTLGCSFINMPMDNNGTHPGRDLKLLLRYFQMFRSERPMAYLGYTVKPNVYGSLAAHCLRIPVINNISGLGRAFISNTLLTSIVRSLYKVSLYRSHGVLFQNPDDQALFIRSGLVRPESTDLIPGSGIDLTSYSPVPPAPDSKRPIRFLLVARMLRDKGVVEFVEAAKIVLQRLPDVQFQLLGMVDSANSNSIPLDEIKRWEAEGWVRYLGKTDDVRPYLADSDCVVLPSYREGLPRSLLEAAAMSRPIIATDVAGCHDIVEHNINGLLCRVRDPYDLADKMLQMSQFSSDRRHAMGMAGRQKVISQFDEKIVILKYLSIIDQIAAARDEGREKQRALST